MDDAVAGQSDGARFVTALLAELDTTTGRLTWLSAGHPAPLLVRPGETVEAACDPVPPLGTGLAAETPVVSEDYLELGDVVVLYTDGLTEARDLGGAMLDVPGLAELVQREAAVGSPVPEMVRRIRGELLAREDA